MYSELGLKKIATTSYLLEDPATQIINDLVDEIFRLRLAIKDIINPLGLLERNAEETECELSPLAYHIAKDYNFLQEIAKKALEN